MASWLSKHRSGRRVFRAALCMVIGAVVSACATARIDPVEAHMAALVILPDDAHAIIHPHAYIEGGDLVVFGKIDPAAACSRADWIDLSIAHEDATLYRDQLPRRMPGKNRPGWHGAHFRTRVPLQLPRGAQIQLSYHCGAPMRVDAAL